MKAVSGVLVTKGHQSGRAVIDYARNEIVDGDLNASDLKKERIVAEPHERLYYYESVPCHTVSLRQVEAAFLDEDNLGSRPSRMRMNSFNIQSNSTPERLTIEWDSPGYGEIEEISYLAIGNTATPSPGPY